ncbi:MAG: hypothetical protein JWQ71_414 [Pedosphaera sp.]|nr:hypothetical protein [Pedosphaera sp.]
MKRTILMLVLVICVSLGVEPLQAGPTNQPPAVRPATELDKLIAEIRNLPPAEQQARIKAFNEKHGLKEEDLKKQQEAVQKMTPEQRQAKIKTRLAELQKKKAAGTLTPVEQGRLQNLEGWVQNQEKGKTSAASSTNKPPVPRK